MTQLDQQNQQELTPQQQPPQHPDGQPQGEGFDPARQSLSDALRVSFFLLKIIMLVLLVAYLASGIFWVAENQQVVRLRFGRIVGDPSPTVYESGWHFGLPYPIERPVRVPTNSRTLNINNAYWYDTGDSGRPPRGALNPVQHGYLVTGDQGIVHGRFRVSYHITDPVKFVRNVGELTGRGGRTVTRASELVRSVAEQGIVHAVARTGADQVNGGQASTGRARARMQEILTRINSGITIQSVSLSDAAMPSDVQQAYQSASNAEGEKAQQIKEARQQRQQILGGAAGQAGYSPAEDEPGPLLQLINQYQQAVRQNEPQTVDQLDQQLSQAFQNLSVPTAGGQAIPIGGEAASIINNARSYVAEVEQTILTERNTFLALHEQFQSTPRILVNRLWQDARQNIFTASGVDTFYSLDGRTVITTNRDPEVTEQRESERLQRARQQAEEQAEQEQ